VAAKAWLHSTIGFAEELFLAPYPEPIGGIEKLSMRLLTELRVLRLRFRSRR
jgi:hypothetical protein